MFESGGGFRLKSLRRDEHIMPGQTIGSSSQGDYRTISEVADQPRVAVWDDLEPNTTMMLFQMYSERSADKVSVLSRCRGVASPFSDMIRYAIHWSADPQYRKHILDMFDKTSHIPGNLISWNPGTRNPIYVPSHMDSNGLTLSAYGLDFWHDLRDVPTMYLAHVFASSQTGDLEVFVRARGLTRAIGHDDVFQSLWRKGAYERRTG